jgi:hypothetical protein
MVVQERVGGMAAVSPGMAVEVAKATKEEKEGDKVALMVVEGRCLQSLNIRPSDQDLVPLKH